MHHIGIRARLTNGELTVWWPNQDTLVTEMKGSWRGPIPPSTGPGCRQAFSEAFRRGDCGYEQMPPMLGSWLIDQGFDLHNVHISRHDIASVAVAPRLGGEMT